MTVRDVADVDHCPSDVGSGQASSPPGFTGHERKLREGLNRPGPAGGGSRTHADGVRGRKLNRHEAQAVLRRWLRVLPPFGQRVRAPVQRKEFPAANQSGDPSRRQSSREQLRGGGYPVLVHQELGHGTGHDNSHAAP